MGGDDGPAGGHVEGLGEGVVDFAALKTQMFATKFIVAVFRLDGIDGDI